MENLTCIHCGNLAKFTAQAFLNDMPESGKFNLCEDCANDYKTDSRFVVENLNN